MYVPLGQQCYEICIAVTFGAAMQSALFESFLYNHTLR